MDSNEQATDTVHHNTALLSGFGRRGRKQHRDDFLSRRKMLYVPRDIKG